MASRELLKLIRQYIKVPEDLEEKLRDAKFAARLKKLGMDEVRARELYVTIRDHHLTPDQIEAWIKLRIVQQRT